MSGLSQRCRGRWPSILSSLGFPEQALNGKHQACPCSGEGKDRFRFDPKKEYGAFVCHCTDGQYGGGFDLLKCWQGWDFPEAAKQIESVIGESKVTPSQPKRDPCIGLRKLWSECKVSGSTVSNYLSSRGLSGKLREHPNLNYYQGKDVLGSFPAMIALVRDSEGPVTVHCTYLNPDGTKACINPNKKVKPAVRPLNSSYWIELKKGTGRLFVAEGIETALSAIPLFSANWVYSLISTDGMRKFEAPEGCEQVTILADNDKSFAGQSAAYYLAEKLTKKGIEVEILTPPNVGDWNDELMLRRTA